MRKSMGEKIFTVINVAFLVVLSIAMLYPLLNILAISLNEGKDATLGGIGIFPRKFTLFNYQVMLQTNDILGPFIFSVVMTVTRVLVMLACTSALAYALTRKDLLFKKTITTLFLITMFIGGGLIPFFLVVRTLGLMNNFLVFILPYIFDFFYCILLRVYFQSNIPESLIESAHLDGGNDFVIFTRIVIPLSTPVLAAIALFIGVAAWNDWMNSMLFCSTNKSLWTLQFILQRLVMKTEQAFAAAKNVSMRSAGGRAIANTITPQVITYATLIVATVPIMAIYPFLQKYFVQGIMIGAVKG